jgi:hypothetical protein
MSRGKSANNSVNAATPPADAPITMTSRLMPPELSVPRPLNRFEVDRLLTSLFHGMGRLDHRSNREALLSHFADTTAHRLAILCGQQLGLCQCLLVSDDHLFEHDMGGPQKLF